MIEQHFSIGEHDWHIDVYYDVDMLHHYHMVKEALYDAGCPMSNIATACEALEEYNAGYTFTNFKSHRTLMFIGKTTSAEQMYDTIQHETRHAADNIGEYYNLAGRGEDSAYLQGEIARKMFPAAAMAVCPKCNCYRNYVYP